MKSKVQTIQKEEIKFLKFPEDDVLKQKLDKTIRFEELKRALILGNIEKEKVKIYFADDKGLKRVETTVWGITEKSVILKQCTVLPLQRIIAIA